MKNFPSLVIVLLLLLLTSCKDDEVDVVAEEEARIEAHFDTLDVDVSRAESGLYAYPITQGGVPKAGFVLSISYKIWVLGADSATTSIRSLDTVVVKKNANAIYPIGIDEALSYMKEGEKWGFVLPSYLAFGNHSFPHVLIPAEATMAIEIELLEVRSETDVLDAEVKAIAAYIEDNQLRDTVNYPLNQPEMLTNGMVYKRLKAGTGATPQSGQFVSVTYEGRFLDGTVFDRAPNADVFEFYMGTGSVIPGFEIGVERIQLQEKALIIMPSYLGYRESAVVIPHNITSEVADLEIIPSYASKVPPYTPLVFEIEVIGIN
ncbi:MAG: FKBP-type peptidyl-prolyl cis-trans isomerase [Marinoscillum sp.]|uniref:FKBP-type peptidyl-prolyl cis-trans isomerase n=1 Tax=Marinoscillum sp. TaxID=2024838 RepID=UPI0032FA2D08